MRIGKILLLAILLTWVGRIHADNLLVQSDTLNVGSTAQIAVCLNNPEHQYVAFQFDLCLPEGITIATDDKGRLSASLNHDRFHNHSLSVTVIGSNTYRFLAYSLNNAVGLGSSGAIVNILLRIGKDVNPGAKTGELKSQTFIFPNGKDITWDDASFVIEVQHVLNGTDTSAEEVAKEKVKPVGTKGNKESWGKVYDNNGVTPE